MLIQALLLIAVIVLVSGSIITSTIVSAKTALSHAVIAQSQTAMSDATAEFVLWAQRRVKDGTTHTSWSPRIVNGRSDNILFRNICGASPATSLNDTGCDHAEKLSWSVIGTTDQTAVVGNAIQQNPVSYAENMSRPVDEQRLSAIISADVDSNNGRLTYSSTSRMITARILDTTPYLVITGTRDIASSSGSVTTNQGDSGGYNPVADMRDQVERPRPSQPNKFTETRIKTTVNCKDSALINPRNPYAAMTSAIEAGRDGDMDWSFQIPCVPGYATPPPPADPTYIAPNGTLYSTVDGNHSAAWNADKNSHRQFPR